MSLYLHTIKSAAGATKKRKRVGRGNSSGHGTYSTRGLKGQKSRSGVSGLKRLGMKQMLLRTPKKAGFNSDKPKNQIVKLVDINKLFKDGDIVNPRTLQEKNLVINSVAAVKILGGVKLQLHNLQFIDVKLSQSVIEQLPAKKAPAAKTKKNN